jgi:hypothetical protein
VGKKGAERDYLIGLRPFFMTKIGCIVKFDKTNRELYTFIRLLARNVLIVPACRGVKKFPLLAIANNEEIMQKLLNENTLDV